MKLVYVTILFLSANVTQAQTMEQGRQQLYYERFLSAKETFYKIIQQQPENGEAWFNLVKTYFLLEQPNLGYDTLLKAPANVKADPFFRIAEGWSSLHKKSKDEAVAYFDDILGNKKKKDDDIVAAIAWVQINAPDGNVNYAVNLLNDVIKKSKHNPELLVLLGDAWRKQANGTEAFKAYQKAIQEDKNYAVAYYRMGQIFVSQKNAPVYTDYFTKAITADPKFSPAWYNLYLYQFNRNPAKAMEYYSKYSSNADHTIQTEYDLADLLYLNQQYDKAIEKAKTLQRIEQDNIKPRIYKLIAYSNAGKKDTAAAIKAMNTYFTNEADSNIIAKDYESMCAFYSSTPGQDSLAAVFLAKATTLEDDSTTLYTNYKRLADMAKDRKDYAAQAKWLGKFCEGNANASNLDLFYWGIANYRVENYAKADSVFGIYISKYPDQSFGYYWQAKSKALQDTSMATGLAIPAYEKLVEVLNKNTGDENYKKWVTEAYGYLAAYAVNSKKDFETGISYFQKVLAIDPENSTAKRYVEILDKRLKKAANADDESSTEQKETSE